MAIGGLFIAIGHEPRNALVGGQIDLDPDGYIRTVHDGSARSRTNLAGVFAAGDVVDKHYRQAITAAASGCQAAIDAERYLAATVDSASPCRQRPENPAPPLTAQASARTRAAVVLSRDRRLSLVHPEVLTSVQKPSRIIDHIGSSTLCE